VSERSRVGRLGEVAEPEEVVAGAHGYEPSGPPWRRRIVRRVAWRGAAGSQA
jgi:hypothetical protein